MPQPRSGSETRTVNGHKALEIECPKRFHAPLQARRGGIHEVCPANHGMDRPPGEERFDIPQGVDDTGVGAAQNHNDPVGRVHKCGLIVGQIVRFAAQYVLEERTTGVLEVGKSGNRPRNEHALTQFHGPLSRDDLRRITQSGVRFRGHSDITACPIGVSGELRRERAGMRNDTRPASVFEHVGQPPCMVIVAVTEHDRVSGSKVDAEATGVQAHNARLPRIEQDSASTTFEPERKAMFGQQPMALCAVLNEHGEIQVVH